MLGVSSVETLIHQLEETLEAVKQGKKALSALLCDRLYQVVDAVRQLVHEAVTGENAKVDVFSVLEQLLGADIALEQQTVTDVQVDWQPDPPLFPPVSDVDALFPDTAIAPLTIPAAITPAKPETASVSEPVAPAAEVSTVQISNYQIDTIRVEPQKLDILMTQAGELTVTKLRLAHLMTEIEELVTLWEEWSRETFGNRLNLANLERGAANNTLKQVQDFHHRAEQRVERLGILINRLKTTANADTARLDIVANQLESGIRTLRLLPLSTIFNLFPRMVRDLAKQQAKEVNLVIEGGETPADKRILEEMKDPLLHMLRNAIDHGIEPPSERELLGKPRAATIRLRGYQTAGRIAIEMTDDGRGLNVESIKRTAVRRGVCSETELAKMTTAQIQSLIFAPGFSTRTTITEISGRGVGLDVVRANVERLKGTISVESTPGMGCKFAVQLNATLATTHVLIVEVNRVAYALPVEFVQTTLLVERQQIFTIAGYQTIVLNEQPVSVARLADLLELQPTPAPSPAAKLQPCIILQVGTERLGLFVEALLDEQDVVLKPQSKLLQRVRNVSGATILGTGQVCMILNPYDLLKSVRQRSSTVTPEPKLEIAPTKLAILLVEDSITIRTQVKRILESAGYEVTAAVDGLDGYNKLKLRTFDAVVSDVQMPNLDGLSLAAKIRQHKEYSELPIVLVTSLATEEDKRRGAEAGANAYITKGTFEQNVLLQTLSRLV